MSKTQKVEQYQWFLAMAEVEIHSNDEGFSQITDLADYLDNNRIIAHYCGFDIMKPLPSYWTYDRFLKKWITLY